MNENKLDYETQKTILRKLIRELKSSHAFSHIVGTTQTTTNNLEDYYVDESGIKQPRTTRQGHSEQVAEVSKIIAQKTFGNDSIVAIEATLIALAHDIGHCVFGHDGEKEFNKYLQSKDLNSNNSMSSTEIKERRRLLFGSDYEDQLGKQDDITSWDSSSSFGFDHAEESALVLREIVESSSSLEPYKNLAGFNEYIDKLVQSILFHSKPAFQTNDPSSQIVSIADSIAFNLDDINQFLGFGRIDEATAQQYLDENGIPLDIEAIKDKTKLIEQATAEAVAFSKEAENNGKIYNGSHYRDLNWLIKATIESIVKNNQNLDKIYDSITINIQKAVDDFLDQSIPGEKALADKLLSTLENLKMINGNTHLDKNNAYQLLITPLQSVVDERWVSVFPTSFACNKMHSAVSEKVIFKTPEKLDDIITQSTGNQVDRDKGAIKFMLEQAENDFLNSAKQDQKEISMTAPISIQEFKEIFSKTPMFKTLVDTMIHNVQHQFPGMPRLSLSELSDLNPQSQVDTIFTSLGFNDNFLANNFAPAELIVKIMSRQTNEFFRCFEERTVANIMGITYEDFRQLSAEQRISFEAASNVAKVNKENIQNSYEEEYQRLATELPKKDVHITEPSKITAEQLSRLTYDPYLARVCAQMMQDKILQITNVMGA